MLSLLKHASLTATAGLLGILSQPLMAADNDSAVTIIEPKKQAPKAESAAIDTEKFELGIFFGSLAVEDFGSNQVTGLSFVYHINSDFIGQINYGRSDVGRATPRLVIIACTCML